MAHYHDAQKFNENQPSEGIFEEFLKLLMYRMDIAPHH
jgi:hypothetical protein